MMIKENYENISKHIFDCYFRIGNDKHHGLKEIINAAILDFIDENPKYTIYQIDYIISNLLLNTSEKLKIKLKAAYPRANTRIQKRVNINKLFVTPVKRINE